MKRRYRGTRIRRRRRRVYRPRRRHVVRFTRRPKYRPSYYSKSFSSTSYNSGDCSPKTIYTIIGVIVAIIVLLGIVALFVGAISCFSTLGWRQNQINLFNGHLDVWNHSYSDMNDIKLVQVNEKDFSRSNSKRYDPKHYRSAEDDPQMKDFKTIFFHGSVVFPSLSWYDGRTESFSVWMDGKHTSTRVKVFYEESYECNCVETCYSCRRSNVNKFKQKKSDEIRRYWDDDDDWDDNECCYETCDTCYDYYRLSSVCFKVNPKSMSYVSVCGNSPTYSRTSETTQSVFPTVEVRHIDDPDMFFLEVVTGNTALLHWTDGAKIITGIITSVIGFGLTIVIVVGALVIWLYIKGKQYLEKISQSKNDYDDIDKMAKSITKKIDNNKNSSEGYGGGKGQNIVPPPTIQQSNFFPEEKSQSVYQYQKIDSKEIPYSTPNVDPLMNNNNDDVNINVNFSQMNQQQNVQPVVYGEDVKNDIGSENNDLFDIPKTPIGVKVPDYSVGMSDNPNV